MLALLASGCVLEASADLPPIEVSRAGIAIPGVPVDELGGDRTFTFTFTQAVSELAIPSAIDVAVTSLSTTLSSSDGATELSFIHALRITVAGTGAAASGLAPVVVGTYQKGDGAVGPTLVAPGQPSADLLAHWKAQPLLLTVTVAGDLPTTPWTIDLAARIGLRLSQ